jgi:hypothetical protein
MAVTDEEWLAMAQAHGVAAQGGPANGLLVPPTGPGAMPMMDHDMPMPDAGGPTGNP